MSQRLGPAWAAAVWLLMMPATGSAAHLRQHDSTEKVAALADSLYFAADPMASLTVCERSISGGADGLGVRWRATRAAIALGMLTTDMVARTTNYDVALTHARRAVQMSPKDNDGRYWLAAAAGRRARADDLRLGIRLANEVHAQVSAILAADSMHAGAHHALGMLHLEALKIPRWVRLIVTHVMGLDVARHATWADAEEHLARAVALEPEMVVYLSDLADLYGRSGRVIERDRALARLAAMPPRHPMDSSYRDACLRRWPVVAVTSVRR